MGIERSRRMKISFRIQTRFTFLYRQFLGDFSTYTFKYVNKTSHFANNLYFGHNERRFHSEFHSRVKFRSKFTWFPIDISFRIECSIRNEKWNELDPGWVATLSGFMFKKYKTFSVLISTRVEIGKTRNCVGNDGHRAECFHIILSFSNFHECWYNCISIRKKCFIFLL